MNPERKIYPDWTGFKDKKFWDWLDLLLVPFVLAVGISLMEVNENKAQRYSLNEQYKQQMLRDYLKDMTSLIFDQQKMVTLRNAEEFSPQREVLTSRTYAILEVFGEDQKRSQIIRFIGNSSLSRFISIRRSNLNNLDLSHVNLSGIDLRKTDLSNTKLTGANLKEANLAGANLKEANLEGVNICGADLSNANLQNTSLANAKYNEKTTFSKNSISKLQIQSMNKYDSKSCDMP